MATPIVSVVIPNFNHGPYLVQRIESVLDQTFQDIEVILLDDCSTDKSRELLEQFRSHPKVREVVYNSHNSGSAFKQWQKGLTLSNGEWIWFAESDDYADLQFLEKMINAIGDQEGIGLAYCDSRIVEGDKLTHEVFREIKNKRFQTERWSSTYRNSGGKEIEDYLLPGGTINNSSAVLFNRKIFQQVNPFDLNLNYIGDKYAFIKVLSVSDVLYVPEALNFYRNPFRSLSHKRFIYYFYEQFLIFDWVLRNLKISDTKSFYRGFHENTKDSIFTGWTKTKFRLYLSLLRTNPALLLRSISTNTIQNFLNRIS
ncbi:MAG: glycosyltransferase family 2 protein [Flammeovirgaceae bacterium]|nr:glycosyltransferase family 2 protein [Flammeovirgaceae bacterium]